MKQNDHSESTIKDKHKKKAKKNNSESDYDEDSVKSCQFLDQKVFRKSKSEQRNFISNSAKNYSNSINDKLKSHKDNS